jgi:hypothetical protein
VQTAALVATVVSGQGYASHVKRGHFPQQDHPAAPPHVPPDRGYYPGKRRYRLLQKFALPVMLAISMMVAASTAVVALQTP